MSKLISDRELRETEITNAINSLAAELRHAIKFSESQKRDIVVKIAHCFKELIDHHIIDKQYEDISALVCNKLTDEKVNISFRWVRAILTGYGYTNSKYANSIDVIRKGLGQIDTTTGDIVTDFTKLDYIPRAEFEKLPPEEQRIIYEQFINLDRERKHRAKANKMMMMAVMDVSKSSTTDKIRMFNLRFTLPELKAICKLCENLVIMDFTMSDDEKQVIKKILELAGPIKDK